MSKIAFAIAAQKVTKANETERQRIAREKKAEEVRLQTRYKDMISENDRRDQKQAAVFKKSIQPALSMLKGFITEEKLTPGQVPPSYQETQPYSPPSREIILRHKSTADMPSGGKMQITIKDFGDLSYVYHGAGLPVKVTPAEMLEKIALFVEKYDPKQLKQLAAKAPKPRR